jgi:hypothetical protein
MQRRFVKTFTASMATPESPGYLCHEGLNEGHPFRFTDTDHLRGWLLPEHTVIADVDDVQQEFTQYGTYTADQITLSNLRPLWTFFLSYPTAALIERFVTYTHAATLAQLIDPHVHIEFFKHYVHYKPEVLSMIQDPPDELTKYALQRVPHCYIHLARRATPAATLIAVSEHGCVLEFVHDQSHEIVLAAVTNTGLALRWVNQHLRSYTVCLAALKQDRRAAEHIPPRIWQLMMERLTLQ